MSRNNTGNPIGSKAFPDFEDNVKNLDQAVNAEQDTFQDRLGKSRLTWAGIVKAGSGDPAIAVDAAARAEAAASDVEQNAEQIAQDAAQQAVQDVVAGVDGQVAVAQSAADRAEIAADIASTAGLIFPTSAEGQASSALTSGDYFWVESGAAGGPLELWRKGAATPTNTGRTTVSENLVATVQREMTPRGELWEESSNLLNATANTIGKQILLGGDIVDNTSRGHTDYIPVVPGGSYMSTSFTSAAFYDAGLGYISFNGVVSPTGASPWIAPARARFVRLNYQTSHGAVPTARVNAGTTLRDYEEYYRKLLPQVRADFSQVTGQITSLRIQERAVTPAKTTFLQPSSNLYDSRESASGLIIRANGAIEPHTDYSVSGPIEVVPGQPYSISGQGAIYTSMALYSDMGFHSRVDKPNVATPFVPPENVNFIRLNYQGELHAPKMVNKGSTPLPYVPSGATLTGIDLGEDVVESVTEAVLGEYIEPSRNLFNHNAVTPGLLVNASGQEVANDDFTTTDFIPVEAGTPYTFSSEPGRAGFTFTSLYTRDRVFVSRINTTSSAGPVTITIPSNVRFLRLHFQGGLTANQKMLNEGDLPLEYELYRKDLKGVSLGPEIIRQLGSELRLTPNDRVMYDMPIDGVFSTDKTWPEHGSIRSTTAAQIYQMYDDLMAQYPSYISKQLLGEDDFGNDISLYRFTPERPSSSRSTRLPLIYLTAGVHGYEHSPALMIYIMMSELCSNWESDQLLELLRFNVEFLIIPVANPSGWDDYTRENRNGVDINRNFADGWTLGTPGSGTYGGPEPLSEPESRYIAQVFEENPEIDIYYDHHEFAGAPGWTNAIWVLTADNQYVQHMAQSLVSRMTRKWRREYDWIPPAPYFAGYTDNTNGGMTQNHARSVGIKLSGVYEFTGRWWVDPASASYDSTHKKTAVESLVNWMLINLRELQRDL